MAPAVSSAPPCNEGLVQTSLQEALEAEAERDMSGLGRSISTMSFGSGEREQLAHQFSGNVGGALGSAPALAKTGAPSRPCC